MRVAGPGVEEQIGGAQAGDVAGEIELGGEEHALGCDAAGGELAQQVLLRVRVPRQHPQHRARRVGEDARPQVQHVGRQLVRLVEAAQHDGVVGQAQLGTRRAGRQRARGVVGLVAAVELGDVFGVVRGVGQRRDDAVAHEVVDERRAGGGRVAEIAGLHRRGPVGHQLHAAVARMALEVDQDVDAVVANALGHGAVAGLAHIDEVLAGGAHAAADVGVVVAAVRVQEGLEAARVAALQQFRHQHRGGVVIEVGRQVAHADAAGAARAGGRQRHEVVGEAGDAALGEAALLQRRRLDGDQREGQQQPGRLGVVAIDGVEQRAGVGGVVLPVAGLAVLLHHQAQREGAGGAVVERDRGAEALGGLQVHCHVHEAQAQAIVHDRRIHLQRQRLEIGIDGQSRVARLEQGVAVGVVIVVIARRVFGQCLQRAQRIGGAGHLQRQLGRDATGDGAAAIEFARALRGLQRGDMLAQRHARAGQVDPHQRVGRRQVGGALEFMRRRVPALGALRMQAGLTMGFGAARAGIGARR